MEDKELFLESIKQIESEILIKKTENKKVESEIEKINLKNEELFEKVDNGIKSIELIEQIASFERSHIKFKIEKVVSDALKLIYGDGHRIEIDYSIKRNRSCVDISYVKDTDDGEVKRQMGGFGGGVADTISFPLKLLILLASKVSDRIFIADEPGKHIDINRIEKFGDFLQELSTKIGLQLIICTHHEALKDYADNVYEVSIPDGSNKSEVKLIKNARTILQNNGNYIKRLKLKNFESHANTEVQFCSGFNAIVGESDCGKSSLIRAIAALCYNKFDNACMRIGCKQCVIELETTRGIVKLTKGTANKYEVEDFRDGQKYEFNCVNKTVPDIVYDITGLRPLVVGDITDIPNILFQLDKHYMLSEVNGSDCNSNMIARITDSVVGLGGIEELINDISSDVNKNKRQITSNINLITDLKTSLNDETIINDLELKLKNIKSIFNEWVDLSNVYDKVSSFVEDYKSLLSKFENKEEMVEFDIELLNNLQLDIQNKVNLYNDLIDFKDHFDSICFKIKTIDKELSNYSNVEDAEKLLLNLNNIIGKFIKLEEYYTDYSDLMFKIQQNNASVNVYLMKEEKAKNDLDNFKKSNKCCPLCGKSFGECDE